MQKFDISDSESFVVTTTSREEIKDEITYGMLFYSFKYMIICISHMLTLNVAVPLLHCHPMAAFLGIVPR